MADDNARIAAPPRNLVSLEAVSRAYTGDPVLAGVSLGVAAGDRIGVVGPQRRRQVDAAAPDRAASRSPTPGVVTRTGGLRVGAARPGRRPRRRRARSAQELVGGRADHEWAGRRALPRRARRAARRRRRWRASRDGLDTADRAAVGRRAAPHRARAAAARPARSCCCSTSRPTTSTSRASTGSRATSRRAAARCSSSPTTAGSSTPSAPRTWEVADGDVHQYEGGYAAYVLARAERDRIAAAARGAPPASCCARSSRGCGAGRRRARRSRSSASRPPTR